jgi:hypothetical protein
MEAGLRSKEQLTRLTEASLPVLKRKQRNEAEKVYKLSQIRLEPIEHSIFSTLDVEGGIRVTVVYA